MNIKNISKLFLFVFLVSNFNFDNCQAKLTKKKKIFIGLSAAAIVGTTCFIKYFNKVDSEQTFENSPTDDLREACKFYSGKTSFEEIKLAINNGANVNTPEILFKETPLHMIFDINTNSETDLRFEAIKLLINNGADINAKDYQGNTALHKECNSYTPSKKVIEHLLNNGANINDKNKDNKTPMHNYFDRVNNKPYDNGIVNLFIEYGADINIINNFMQ